MQIWNLVELCCAPFLENTIWLLGLFYLRTFLPASTVFNIFHYHEHYRWLTITCFGTFWASVFATTTLPSKTINRAFSEISTIITVFLHTIRPVFSAYASFEFWMFFLNDNLRKQYRIYEFPIK